MLDNFYQTVLAFFCNTISKAIINDKILVLDKLHPVIHNEIKRKVENQK